MDKGSSLDLIRVWCGSEIWGKRIRAVDDTEMSGVLAEVEGSLERLEGERALLASLRPV